jgi:ligand-binding SRPBCC domain-containing protein
MAQPQSIELVSELTAPADVVWQHAASVAGINAELWPIRMHLPHNPELLIRLAETGGTRGVLISLLGFLPLDWHWLGIERLTPGRGFHEASSSLVMRRWVHIRTIEPTDGGCTVRDRVEFTPRVPLISPLVTPLYGAVFRRRHRVLRERFGSSATSAD